MNKKITFLLTLFIAQSALGMQQSQEKLFNALPGGKKTQYFMCCATTAFILWRSLPWLAQTLSQDPVTKQIGFDPLKDQVILCPDKGKTPILCAQGWPNEPNASKIIWPSLDKNKEGLENSNTFIIDCNPQDSINFHSKTVCGLILGLRTINFGDYHDAQAILYTLIKCYEAGHTKVYGFGHCCGGSAWINALDMLQNPASHTATWKKLGMIDTHGSLDIKKIGVLKTMVENGYVFLGNPLIHSDYPFERIANNITNGLTPNLLKFITPITSSFGKFLIKIFLALLTNYNPLRIQPYEILKKITKQNSNFKILVDFACYEPVVGNIFNEEIIQHSKQHNNLTVRKGTWNRRDSDKYLNQSHSDLTGSFDYARKMMQLKKDK